jgi:hypothetical protein
MSESKEMGFKSIEMDMLAVQNDPHRRIRNSLQNEHAASMQPAAKPCEWNLDTRHTSSAFARLTSVACNAAIEYLTEVLHQSTSHTKARDFLIYYYTSKINY